MNKKKAVILVIYLVKCVIGIVLAYELTTLLQLKDIASWCLLSTLLVLAPDTKDSYKLAITRIKANLVGAGVGLLILTVYTTGMVWVLVGVVLAITICYLFKIETGARSAAVAIIIILMHDELHHWWEVAVDRAFGVLLGCALGMAITFIFHQIEKWWDKRHAAMKISDEQDTE